MTRELIENIVDREWSMFDRVRNEGGRASCQNDPATFRIMRTSQFMTWPEDLLRSYLADLETADRVGRNLLTEKYAFMMESTSPFEFRRIRHMLPVPDQDSLAWIREIVNTHVNWERRTDQAYPRVRSKGRPLTLVSPVLMAYLEIDDPLKGFGCNDLDPRTQSSACPHIVVVISFGKVAIRP